ncbi:hypothetical protein PQS32_01635 [Sphingomonas koreensis]|nr:hypothetical protein [Sphingomonas koreensis]MDC7808832.1 hypothetical protein [Sphingomonas koreensis]
MLRPAIVIALDHTAHDFGGEELLLQAAEDAALKLGRADATAVDAGARFAAPDAAPAILGDDRVGSTAHTTTDQAREDVACTLLTIVGDGGIGVLLRLNRRPSRGIDDAQVRRGLLDSLGRFCDPRNPLPCVRVLLHPDPSIDDTTVIGWIVENTVLATAGAGDGVGAPFRASRRRYSLAIELVCDRFGANAREVIGEDPPNYGGLALHNPAMAALDRSILE